MSPALAGGFLLYHQGSPIIIIIRDACSAPQTRPGTEKIPKKHLLDGLMHEILPGFKGG